MRNEDDILDELIGRSDAILSVRALIEQVAPSDISVLITGESGTGKEVAAGIIHKLSRRSDRRMVTVNCGAIPEGIFESEVFGHERGSFTGADRQRKGYFETADGGIVFLDEIGEMPLNSQVKILRILESGEFMRVGGSHPIKVNVRVIAATNRDLTDAVNRGEFRRDLFFRLKAVNIYLPSLNNRREDIPLLASHFIQEFCRQNNIPLPGINGEAMSALTNNNWEGNVRELKNFVESMVILERSKTINRDSVLKLLPKGEQSVSNLPVFQPRSAEQLERELIYRTLLEIRRDIWELKNFLIPHYNPNQSIEIESQSMNELEKEQIINALAEFNGNRRRAADKLGIGERTLYRKIKKYGL